jgi:hypothetical protein
VLSILEGGYDLEATASSAVAHVKALVGVPYSPLKLAPAWGGGEVEDTFSVELVSPPPPPLEQRAVEVQSQVEGGRVMQRAGGGKAREKDADTEDEDTLNMLSGLNEDRLSELEGIVDMLREQLVIKDTTSCLQKEKRVIKHFSE